MPKSKAKAKAKAKAKGKAKALPKTKATAKSKAKAVRPKKEAAGEGPGKKRGIDSNLEQEKKAKELERRARLSRKSSAYHQVVARYIAMGMSPEEAKCEGRKVTCQLKILQAACAPKNVSVKHATCKRTHHCTMIVCIVFDMLLC